MKKTSTGQNNCNSVMRFSVGVRYTIILCGDSQRLYNGIGKLRKFWKGCMVLQQTLMCCDLRLSSTPRRTHSLRFTCH